MATLSTTLQAALPYATEELTSSQHLAAASSSSSSSTASSSTSKKRGPSGWLAAELHAYLYSFARDPAHRPCFGPFKFKSESSKGKQRANERYPNDRGDIAQDEEEDQDDQDSEGEEEEEWTLSAAQARGDSSLHSSGLASEYSKLRKGKPCGHVFKKGESVYRCKECSLDESCVLCARCFKSSSHAGHEVSFSMHSGAGGSGCCDCGDPEAFKCEIDCAYHHPDTPYPSASATGSTSEPEGAPVPPVTAELEQLLRSRIREAVDFMLTTLAPFPRDTTAPSDPRVIRATRPLYRLPHEHYDKPGSFEGPWSVILWNDEKHEYQQVIDQLVSATRCSRTQALASAVRIDSYGLEVVSTGTDPTKLWKVAHVIGRIGLGITVCATRDAAVLEAAGHVMDWLLDMSRTRVGGGDETLLGRMVAEALLDSSALAKLLVLEDKMWKRARAAFRLVLMALLVVGQDVKLQLGRQYASVYPQLVSTYLLTDREPESSVSYFSVQLFSAPSIATDLVANLNFLPTVLQLLYAFFTQQHIDSATGEKGIRFPPSDTHPPVDPESSSFKHKRYLSVFQELDHLLSHPGVGAHIVQTATYPHEQHASALTTLLDFLNLFAGMNPHTRATLVHVEYETDSWLTAFNLTIQLAKLARSFGRAFNPLPSLSLPYAVKSSNFLAATSAILASIWKTSSEKKTTLRPIQFAGGEWNVIKYECWKDPVSFHHPTHILYAEAMKNLEAWSDDSIREATGGQWSNYAEWMLSLNDGAFQLIADEVLRVLALLAHIRAGLWVRNGFGIRAQCLHYREYNLRENTFDQDVFFLQTAFVTMDPSLLLVSLIDRFELSTVLASPEGSVQAPPYAEAQAARTVLEELLYLLVIVFSEPTDIEAYTGAQQARRELIHALLLAPLNYTDVGKHVTDRVNEDPAFDRVLREVADFRPPDLNAAGSDVGALYSLKKECYAEVDPYYYRYTRNQREEALKILKTHQAAGGVFPPRKLQGKGCFGTQSFTQILATDTFLALIQLAIGFATSSLFTAEHTIADGVVDLCLRLVMIALVEQPHAFTEVAVRPAAYHEVSLYAGLEHLRSSSAAKEHHEKLDYILGQIAKSRPTGLGAARGQASDEVARNMAPAPLADAAAALAEQKKAAAKARQAAIMQQFSAQQQAFLDANMSEDEDDDDESDLDDDIHDLGLINHDHIKQTSNSPMRTDSAAADASAATIQPDAAAAVEQQYKKRKRKAAAAASMGSCIVCQEELNSHNPWGSLALIQTSSLIRLHPAGEAFLQEVYETPADLDADAEHLRPFGVAGIESAEKEGKGGVSAGFPRKTRKGLFASACGHMMHTSCFDTYCSSIQQRHTTQFTRNHPENPDRKEFICPLCKSLGNVLLPVSEEDYEEDPNGAAVAGHASKGMSDAWLHEISRTLGMASTYEMQLSYHLLSHDTSGSLRPWRVSDNLPPHNSSSFGFAQLAQSERKMLERLMSVVGPLDTETQLMEFGPKRSERHQSSLTHELIAYTISCIEIALRGKPTGTLGFGSSAIPEATARLLRSLLSALERLVVLSTGTPRGPELARLALLFRIFNEQQGVHIPHWLNVDPFTLLVEAAAVAPTDFHQFAALAFYSHLLRTTHQLAEDNHGKPHMPSFADKQALNEDQTALADYAFMLHEERWARTGSEVTPGLRLAARATSERVYAFALPFLRRAAILRSIIFPASSTTQQPQQSEAGAGATELSRLLQVLRIPHPRELIGRRHGKAAKNDSGFSSLLEAWDASWQASLGGGGGAQKPDLGLALEHPVIYELLGLPKDIDMLVESSVTRKCRRCRTVPNHPALCLLCGELVCQQSHCCMDQDLGEEPLHGECNMHMWECGTSTGIYLLIKKNAIIYLYADKGAFQAAPYLDSHGEPDLGFRRHRPLYLNRARYDEIRKLWLNHSIATYVARRLEMGSDSGGWNTL